MKPRILGVLRRMINRCKPTPEQAEALAAIKFPCC